jgi:hypothetical protein
LDNDSLTVIACQGWENPDARCPHLFTSRASDAWHLGAELRRQGKPRPSAVAPSRGDRLRLNRHQIVTLDYSPDGFTAVCF